MPRKLTKALFAAAIAVAVSACDGTIYKPGKIDGVDTLSLGARQRLVVVNNKGGLNQDRRVVCAEPSPDVMTAMAASFSASGALDTGGTEAAVAAAGAFREAAASLGTRTQAIQLMRDGYYRACEAMMNGMIDSEEYRVILNNVDSAMITLVGVDAIAGTEHPPAIAISPGISQSTTTATASDTPTASATPGTANETKIEFKEVNEGTKPAEIQAKYIAEIVKTYLTLNDDVRTKANKRSLVLMKKRGHRHIKNECHDGCPE